MNLKQIFKEYFSYTASEKKGLLVLVILLLILYLFPLVFHPNTTVDSTVDLAKQKQLDSLVFTIINGPATKDLDSTFVVLKFFNPNKSTKSDLLNLGFSSFQANNLIKYRSKGGHFEKKTDLLKIYGFDQSDLNRLNDYIQIPRLSEKSKVRKNSDNANHDLFFFDPNEASLSEWEKLGVSKKISTRIKKYLAAGGRFFCASDLKKIYGFNSDKHAELLSYVQIAEKQNKYVPYKKELIQINKADTSQLKHLKGIGSVLSNRIVKYRNILGGFVSKNQLLEVYGISRREFELISPNITIDSLCVQKLALNSFSEVDLRKHPYLNSRTAKDIVRFRNKNGKFNSLDQLKIHKVIPDSIFVKLLPYLELK
jgi:DNA uptake protein ComE-like DNA-binding protein